jgi:hypothetical protein
MKLLAALLLSAAALFGQITSITANPGGAWTSCTSSGPTLNCTVHERQHGFEVNYLQVTTAGTYDSTSTSTGGSIGLVATWCKVNTGDIATCVMPESSDTTPVLYIGFDGYTDDGLSPGSHSGSVSLNSGAFTINVTIVIDAQVFPIQATPSGFCNGCSVSNGRYGTMGDTVAIRNFTPPGTFQPPASAGGSYQDPNLGGVVYTFAPPGIPSPNVTEYSDSVVTSWNADATLKFVLLGDGTLHVHSATSPFPLQWTNPAGTGRAVKWMSTEAKALLYLSGNTVHKVILGTPGNIRCDQTVLTVPGSFSALTDGGDGEMSKDDWWLFATCAGDPSQSAGQDKKLVLASFGGHTGSCSFTTPYYTYDYSRLPNFALRNTNVSNIDSVTGMRYLVAQSPANGGQTAGNELLQFDGTTITDVGPFPTKTGLNANVGLYAGNGACTTAYLLHLSFCQDTQHAMPCEVNGIQGFCTSAYARQHAFYYVLIFERFSAGVPGMGIDTGAGGGLTVILPIGTATHMGAARKGNVLVIGMDSSPVLASWKVTNMTGNGLSPIHVTSDTAYTGINGDVLSFRNVGGNTALNGPKRCTVANLAGTGFDCFGTTGNGIYTSGTGQFYLGTQSLGTGPFGYEIDVVNMPTLSGNNPSIAAATFLRHNITRGCGGSDQYWDSANYCSTQSHPTIAQDGSKISWETNYCYLNQTGVYIGLTGFSSGAHHASGFCRILHEKAGRCQVFCVSVDFVAPYKKGPTAAKPPYQSPNR